MKTSTKIIAGSAVAFAGVTGVIALQPGDTPEPKVQLSDPSVVVWDKPTTDLEWVEDVKTENLDFRSNAVLAEMIASHKDRLGQLQPTLNRYRDCPECVRYDLEAGNPTWSPSDIDTAYQNGLNEYTWQVEKLLQSIERMEKEVDLRERKVVITDTLDNGSKRKQSELDKYDPELIRYIKK